MFSRIAVAFFCFFAIFATTLVDAASLQRYGKRQIGDLQCNINRLQIVGDLGGATRSVKTLQSKLSSDAVNGPLINTVASGISTASSGISDIAAALFTGQTAPAASRDQVRAGLTSAIEAMGNITTTDTTLSSMLQKASSQLNAAGQAGLGVVANCK